MRPIYARLFRPKSERRGSARPNIIYFTAKERRKATLNCTEEKTKREGGKEKKNAKENDKRKKKPTPKSPTTAQ